MKLRAFIIISVMIMIPIRMHAMEHSIGIGAHISNFKASDAQEGKTFIGGHIRARLAGGFGLEASIDYREDTYITDVQQTTIKSVPLLFSATIELLHRSPVTPYFLGGGGWYFTKIDMKTEFFDIHDDQTKFGWHLGGGVIIKPSSRLAVHADYRYTSVDFELQRFKFDAAGRMLTGGVTFYF